MVGIYVPGPVGGELAVGVEWGSRRGRGAWDWPRPAAGRGSRAGPAAHPVAARGTAADDAVAVEHVGAEQPPRRVGPIAPPWSAADPGPRATAPVSGQV